MRISNATAQALAHKVPTSVRKRTYNPTKYTGPMTVGPANTVRQIVDGVEYAGGLYGVVKKVYGKLSAETLQAKLDAMLAAKVPMKQALTLITQEITDYCAITLKLSGK